MTDLKAGDLSPRMAQVTHALMEAWTQHGHGVPVTTAEVCAYDSEALSVRSTAAALARARSLGLVNGTDGLWFATERAWAMRRALETLVLGEDGTGD